MTGDIGPALRFVPEGGPSIGRAAVLGAVDPGETVVVLDTTWTAPRGSAAIGIREVAAGLLAERNLYEEATDLIETWAAAADVAPILAVDGASLWDQARPGHWWWLQERLLWIGLVDRLVRERAPARLVLDPGADPGLADAARLIARRDGLALEDRRPAPTPPDPSGSADPGESPAAPATAARNPQSAVVSRSGPRASPPSLRSLPARVLAAIRARTLGRRGRRTGRAARDKELRRRLAARARLPRVLVLSEHVRQRIGDDRSSREINPYLDPVVDHLAAAGLDWLVLEPRASSGDDATWARLQESGNERLVSGDVLRTFAKAADDPPAEARAAAIAERLAAISTPLVVDGVDLGPELVARLLVASRAALPKRIRSIVRQRRLLDACRPAALVLADEYQRQEWLAAARSRSVPTIAIQHGGMQRWHLGYIQRARHANLTLADHTVVFGDWERRLLLEASVYRPDEVFVGGSPRLDLVEPPVAAARDAVRSELGVARGDRLVVISTTWGDLLRRFHFAVAIARLVAAPLPDTHLVVKLHPSEPDDGLYRRLIDGVADAAGIPRPTVTIVKAIDLYRLLSAADAHVGLYSTVLTEAVVTGTPNFIVGRILPFDLMGYVAAGVATTIRDGKELLDALDRGAGAASPEARAAFLRDHFEPGPAGPRIAAQIARWIEAGSSGRGR